MEAADDTFHSALHSTFRSLSQAAPERYAVINGAQPIEQVHKQVLNAALAVIA